MGVWNLVQPPYPTLGVVGGFFHTDQTDQAHLSQNGDILLKCTLQTYSSCSPAIKLPSKRKMSASHEKSPTVKIHTCTAPLSKSILLFCDRGASLCNPGLLAGDVKIQRIVKVCGPFRWTKSQPIRRGPSGRDPSQR